MIAFPVEELLVAGHKRDTKLRLLAAPPDRNPRYRQRSKIVVGCETGEGSASNKTRNSPFVTPLFSGHTSHLPVFSSTLILPQIALRSNPILPSFQILTHEKGDPVAQNRPFA
jgi:hypothetical protein